mmetsp:Transcript_19982/g.29880  ORF Transcript_19982/g.29880 Transcript_19982/m.29880 type:complete len:606 (+) Transcript_19982:77-1894(+)
MPYTRSTRSGKSRAEAPQPGIDADESAEITENIKELLLPSNEDVSDRARKLLTELRRFPDNFDFNKLGDALIKNIHKKLQLNTSPKTPTLVKNLKFIVKPLPSFNGKSVEALTEVKKELLGIYHLELVGYFPADMNNKEKKELVKDILSLAARRDDEEYYLDLGCDEIMAEVNLVGHQYENGRRPGRSTLVTHLQQAMENYRYQSDDWVKNPSRTVIELRAALFQLNPDLDQSRGIRTKGGLQEAIIKLRNEGKHVPPDPPSSIEVETNYRPHSAQNESAGPKDPPVKNVAPLAALEEEDDNRNGNIAATEGVCNRNDAPGRSAAVAGGVSADDGSRAVNNDNPQAPTDNNNPTIVPPTPKVSFITPATNRQPSNQGPPELGQVAINPDDRNAEGDSSNQGHGQRAQVASTLDVAPNAEGDSPQVSDRDILRAIHASTQAQHENNEAQRVTNEVFSGQLSHHNKQMAIMQQNQIALGATQIAQGATIDQHGQQLTAQGATVDQHGQRISATEVAQATQTKAIANTMGIAQVALLTAQKVLKGKKGLLGRNSDPLQRTGNLFDTPLTRSNDNDVEGSAAAGGGPFQGVQKDLFAGANTTTNGNGNA